MSTTLIKCILLLSIFQALIAHASNELPKFMIIGAQKSGTGALHAMLRQHPRVVNRAGEIHFFDIHFENGTNWYKEQFPKNTQRESIRGDKSPYYFFHPLAPKRAHSIIPDAKLIILLRNPVDRAYSQYWMNVRNKIEGLSFGEAIKAEEERLYGEVDKIIAGEKMPISSNYRIFSYLSRGLYIEQLKRWLAYYPLEQILIISSDDLLESPEKIMAQTLAFLDLPEYDRFDLQIGIKHSYPAMDPQLRQELSEYFRPYNEQLEALLDRKFNWE